MALYAERGVDTMRRWARYHHGAATRSDTQSAQRGELRGLLAGKLALITGASQGLGEHLARELAANGAAVALAARNGERREAIQRSIEAPGGSALAVPTDLSSEPDCRLLIERVHQALGPIDVLVLNAGTGTLGKLEELGGLDAIQDAMAVNFFGAAYPTYYALDDLIANRGLVAYVTSGSGHLPMAGYLGYSTSRHAMNGFRASAGGDASARR
jgi:NAD(P)-dependent dehydrogenase (short-subunit alcohol dehydrogenase family)